MTSAFTELVVIGGSAGALEALLALVPLIPDGFTAPIVLVLHLGANQRNLVPELLRSTGRRRAVEAEDKQPLEPRTIYVAPPNYHLLIERAGTLALSVDDLVNFSRPSIDVLFESAADAFRSRVSGVVLSGANDDGAGGLERIVELGGRAYVQAPATAVHTAMPEAALRRLGGRARALPVPELVTALAPAAFGSYGEGRP